MSEDANNFISNLLAAGFKIEVYEESSYGEIKDFDDIMSEDRFIAKTANEVWMWRDSEHYFSITINLKNGNQLSIEAPIKKMTVDIVKPAKSKK